MKVSASTTVGIKDFEKEMKLPDGKICVDCVHFERCNMLFQCNPNRTSCDFYPSSYKEKP